MSDDKKPVPRRRGTAHRRLRLRVRANIAAAVDTRAVAEHAATLPGVVYATDQPYSCSEPGQAE